MILFSGHFMFLGLIVPGNIRRQLIFQNVQPKFSSVAQLCLTLWLHGLQHARPPCPSPTPGIYSNSCPLSLWCHPTISSSVVPFSSHLQSFIMSQFFTSGSQSIGTSVSVLPVSIQDWFSLGWTGWVSFLSKGLSRVFLNTTGPHQPYLFP